MKVFVVVVRVEVEVTGGALGLKALSVERELRPEGLPTLLPLPVTDTSLLEVLLFTGRALLLDPE